MKILIAALFSLSAFAQTTQFPGNVAFQGTATFSGAVSMTWHTVYSSQIAGLTAYSNCNITTQPPAKYADGTACADASSAFNTVLATASCQNPLWVIVEMGYGVGSPGIQIPHGAGKGCVVLQGIGWTTGFAALKGANSSPINNGYGYSPPTNDTQSQSIGLRDLLVNGYAGTACGSPQCSSNSSSTDNRGNGPCGAGGGGCWIQGVQLYNVNDLMLENVKIIAAPTFAFVCGNCSTVGVYHSTIDQTSGGSGSTDGWHFQGATSYIEVIDTVVIHTGDDSFCIAAAEAAGGNWDHVHVNGLRLVNAYDVGRIYNFCAGASPCGTVRTGGTATIENVSGTMSSWPFSLYGTDTGNTGAADSSGSLILRNFRITTTAASFPNSFGYFNISGHWKELSLQDFTLTAPQASGPLINLCLSLDTTCSVTKVTLSHVLIERTAAGSTALTSMVSMANTTTIGTVVVDDVAGLDQPGPYSAIAALLNVPSGSTVATLQLLAGTSALRNISSLYTSGSGARITTILGTLTRGIGAQWGAKGGATLTTGMTQYLTMPNAACTITKWMATVDTGTITLDIWKIATGTAIPTVANTIVASAPPAVSSATAASSTAVTTWTGYTTGGNVPGVPVAAYDLFGFNISALTGSPTTASVVLECVQ